MLLLPRKATIHTPNINPNIKGLEEIVENLQTTQGMNPHQIHNRRLWAGQEKKQKISNTYLK